jgi:hypothetical protein
MALGRNAARPYQPHGRQEDDAKIEEERPVVDVPDIEVELLVPA